MDRPLIVPGGSFLAVQFARDALGPYSAAALIVDISYIGRYVNDARLPKFADIPYVCAMVGARQAINVSQRGDLENPFQVPLRIHRMIGRLDIYKVGGDDLAFDDLGPRHTISMIDKMNYQICSADMPFNEIFSCGRRALDIERDLDPRSYYDVTVRTFSSVLGGVGDPIFPRPIISMVGTRPEAI